MRTRTINFFMRSPTSESIRGSNCTSVSFRSSAAEPRAHRVAACPGDVERLFLRQLLPDGVGSAGRYPSVVAGATPKKAEMRSIGTGKMMVEFFSAAISVRVWR